MLYLDRGGRGPCGGVNNVNTLIESHRDALADLCRRYDVRRLELFGSAARGDFDLRSSDLDFLVEFAPLSAGQRGAADRYFGLLLSFR